MSTVFLFLRQKNGGSIILSGGYEEKYSKERNNKKNQIQMRIAGYSHLDLTKNAKKDA